MWTLFVWVLQIMCETNIRESPHEYEWQIIYSTSCLQDFIYYFTFLEVVFCLQSWIPN